MHLALATHLALAAHLALATHLAFRPNAGESKPKYKHSWCNKHAREAPLVSEGTTVAKDESFLTLTVRDRRWISVDVTYIPYQLSSVKYAKR